jgi:hypothetical protein
MQKVARIDFTIIWGRKASLAKNPRRDEWRNSDFVGEAIRGLIGLVSNAKCPKRLS